MSNFYNWDDVLQVEGIREEVLKFARTDNELDDFKAYLKEDGSLPDDERELQYLFKHAIEETRDVVFYFYNDGTENIGSHVHYKFHGKYFEFDGQGMIMGPLDYNDPEIILGLTADDIEGHLDEEGVPRDGLCVSVGGEFSDEYFAKHCLKLIAVGRKLEINGRMYVRTETGFELKK